VICQTNTSFLLGVELKVSSIFFRQLSRPDLSGLARHPKKLWGMFLGEKIKDSKHLKRAINKENLGQAGLDFLI